MRSSLIEAVQEAAVIGIPDEKWGERPKAFVVHKLRAEVTEAELIDYLRPHIARYKISRAIEFVDQLPRTSTGRSRNSIFVKRNGLDTPVGSRDE